MSRQLAAENQIVATHLAHTQKTHDIVTNISVRRLLNVLRATYSQTEDYGNFIRQFESQLLIPEYMNHPDYAAVRQKIKAIKNFGKDEWTKLWMYNKDGEEIEDNSYSLQEQFNLVCAVTLYHNSDPHDKKARIHTLWHCILTIVKEARVGHNICGTGMRNDWIFSIGACYPEIELIENLSGYIVEHIKAYLEQSLNQLNPTERFEKMRGWLNKEDAIDDWLETQAVPLKEWLLEKVAVFGWSQKEYQQIDTYVETINSLEAPDINPIIPHIKALLAETKTPIAKQSHPTALAKTQKIWDECADFDMLTTSHLDAFWRVYIAFKNVKQWQDHFFLGESPFQQACTTLLQTTTTYLNALCALPDTTAAPELPVDFELQKETFLQLERLYKSNNHIDFIENFFVHWNAPPPPRAWHSGYIQNRLYQSLLNIKESITLTDAMIAQIMQATNEDPVAILLTPYQINRILLHGLLTSLDEWTSLFAQTFERVFTFVTGSEFTTSFTGNAVQSSSYNCGSTRDSLKLILHIQKIQVMDCSFELKCQQWLRCRFNGAERLATIGQNFVVSQLTTLLNSLKVGSDEQLNQFLSYGPEFPVKSFVCLSRSGYQKLLMRQPPSFFEKISGENWLRVISDEQAEETVLHNTFIDHLDQLAKQTPHFFEKIPAAHLLKLLRDSTGGALHFLRSDALGQKILVKLPAHFFARAVVFSNFKEVLAVLQWMNGDTESSLAFQQVIIAQFKKFLIDYYELFSHNDDPLFTIDYGNTLKQRLDTSTLEFSEIETIFRQLLEKIFGPNGSINFIETFFCKWNECGDDQNKKNELYSKLLVMKNLIVPDKYETPRFPISGSSSILLEGVLVSPEQWTPHFTALFKQYIPMIVDISVSMADQLNFLLKLQEIQAKRYSCSDKENLYELAMLNGNRSKLAQLGYDLLDATITAILRRERTDDSLNQLLSYRPVGGLKNTSELLSAHHPRYFDTEFIPFFERKKVTKELILRQDQSDSERYLLPKAYHDWEFLAQQSVTFFEKIPTHTLECMMHDSRAQLPLVLKLKIIAKLPDRYFQESPGVFKSLSHVLSCINDMPADAIIGDSFKKAVIQFLKKFLAIYNALHSAQHSIFKTHHWKMLSGQVNSSEFTFEQAKNALESIQVYAIQHPQSRTAHAKCLLESSRTNLRDGIISYGRNRSNFFSATTAELRLKEVEQVLGSAGFTCE